MRQAFHTTVEIASVLGVVLAVSPLVSTADDADRATATRAPSGTKETPGSRPSYTPLPAVDANGVATPSQPIQVASIPETLRKEYRLDPFYKKCTAIVGIPIIGSENVSDYAFLECAWTLDHLLNGRTMAHDALLKSKARVGIIAVTEYTMDIPENQRPDMIARGAYNDRRSRGLGGRRFTTCAEENLLNLRGDHYVRENITIHEFSHTVASCIRAVNSDWYDRLRVAYKQAKERGDYGHSYAITDEQEYWAEGAQCWFDCANPRNAGGAAHRDQLKAKDPALAALLAEVYGDGPWRYVKTADRPANESLHLAGLDRSKMPAFDVRKSPRVQATEKASDEAPSAGHRQASKGTDSPGRRL
jgi:alpha-glucosidase